MLVCTHVITLSLQHEYILKLYRYFKRLPDPECPKSQTFPQLLIRSLMKLCILAARCFETTEGASGRTRPNPAVALRNILVTRHNDLCKYLLRQTRQFWNIFINMIAMHCLFLFTTELIVSTIFDLNSNTHKLIKILRNLQSSKFNSSKFNFCLSCKNFCFENNPLYSRLYPVFSTCGLPLASSLLTYF